MDTKSETTELDRLSMLLDSLILHILCLLKDTKIAVQTCVLSKRWRNLWTHLPSLYLCSESFHGSDIIVASEKFNEFVCHIMSQRKPNKIQTLWFSDSYYNHSRKHRELYYGFEEMYEFIDRFIAYATELGVEELETDDEYFLRDCCWSFSELSFLKINGFPETLKLNLSYCPKVFASLTRCQLEHVDLLVEDCGSVDLFSGFVNLEELSLIKCRSRNDDVTISCPRLVSLTISDSFSGSNNLVISAPNLLKFNLENSFSSSNNLVISAPSLLELYVKNSYSRSGKLVISAPSLLKLNLEHMDDETLCLDRCPDLESVIISKVLGYGSGVFRDQLESFHEKVIKNVFPKSKSLVIQFDRWKFEFMKCNNSVTITSPTICGQTHVLAITLDLEYVWNEVDFVDKFGTFVFVTCPTIIIGFIHASAERLLPDGFDHIMAEVPFIQKAAKNWKCHVVRTLDGEVMWEFYGPN